MTKLTAKAARGFDRSTRGVERVIYANFNALSWILRLAYACDGDEYHRASGGRPRQPQHLYLSRQ